MHQRYGTTRRDSSTYEGLWAIKSLQDDKRSSASAFASISNAYASPIWSQDILTTNVVPDLTCISGPSQTPSHPTEEWTKAIDDWIKSETVVPQAYVDNWFRLYLSDLPERVFTDIFASTSRRPVLDGAALSTFLSFWELVRGKCAEPVVSISPKGDVVAEWVKDLENSLVLMAASNRQIHFSLFDKGMPVEGVERIEAVANLIAMLEAREVNPFQWSDANEA